MNYAVYKLEFTSGVHFGKGLLNDSDYVFRADALFSAMYIEALKYGNGTADQFYESTKSGSLRISDALPYVKDRYMIPKPMLHIESARRGDSGEKKRYKKLKYLPVNQLEEFLSGRMSLEQDPMKDFGIVQQRIMAAVRKEEDTQPFHVGIFYFNPGNGLYVIISYAEKEEKELAEQLLEAVSYSGIGGEKSRGLGKFELKKAGKNTEVLMKCLEKSSEGKLLLSTALPREEELESALEGAAYLLGKRSGFVSSEIYVDEQRKKKDLYVFMAGSYFVNCFEGDIYDVSEGGTHPVYRYAKPMFMGV